MLWRLEESNVVCVNQALIWLAWSPAIPESVQSQEIFFLRVSVVCKGLGEGVLGLNQEIQREKRHDLALNRSQTAGS